MPKRRRILVILAIAASAVTLTLLFWPDDELEPQYGGRKLSVWLGPKYLGSSSVSDKDKAEAIEAVQRIGTNAIPFLVKWIAYETPWLTQNLLGIQDRRPLGFLRRPLLEGERRRHPAVGALLAFQILGPRGNSAIPDLNRVMTNPAAFGSSLRAMEALKFIGHDALPYLLASATNSHIATRDRLPQAIAHVAKYENDALPTVAVLVELLKDQDARVAEEAATALGTIGAEPAIAVPALMKAAQDRRTGVRWHAVPALGNFGAHARPAIPVLIKSLDDQNVVVRMRAIEVLAKLRIEPQLVIPALTKIVEAPEPPEPGRQGMAMEALAKFGKAADSAVPAIERLRDDSNLTVRQAATNALRRLAPERLEAR